MRSPTAPDRKAGYEAASKDVSKWTPIVKANREAATLALLPSRADGADAARAPPTTAAMAAAFTPAAAGVEAEVAALLAAARADTAAGVAAAEDKLALKTLDPAAAAAARGRLARMRSLLFHTEAKLKRAKKIKSKEYRRRLAKAARAKATDAAAAGGADPDFLGVDAADEDAELARARERLTLKHRNTSRWPNGCSSGGLLLMVPREALGRTTAPGRRTAPQSGWRARRVG